MQTEATLLEAARQGDMEAFVQLFEPLRPQVYAVAARLVGPDEAGDVVMDAFLKAWEALPKFRGRSSLKTWMYRIVSNCALDRLRSRERRREESLSFGDREQAWARDVPDEATDPPGVRVERTEMVEAIRRAIHELPPQHRCVLELRYVDGLTYGEIAAATGVPLGTVMSRLFHAKRQLRAALKRHTSDET